MQTYIGKHVYTNAITFSQFKQLAKERNWSLSEYDYEIEPQALGIIYDKNKFALLDISPIAYAHIKDNGFSEKNLESVRLLDLKEKTKVDFYFNYQSQYSDKWLHQVLREIPKEELEFESESLLAIKRHEFHILIDQCGSVSMQKEISVYEIEKEIRTAMHIYKSLCKMNSHFNFPWQIKIIAPLSEAVDMTNILSSTRDIHIERNVLHGNLSMVMSGELFM